MLLALRSDPLFPHQRGEAVDVRLTGDFHRRSRSSHLPTHKLVQEYSFAVFVYFLLDLTVREQPPRAFHGFCSIVPCPRQIELTTRFASGPF